VAGSATVATMSAIAVESAAIRRLIDVVAMSTVHLLSLFLGSPAT
jgi:uncharacterized membrane protein